MAAKKTRVDNQYNDLVIKKLKAKLSDSNKNYNDALIKIEELVNQLESIRHLNDAIIVPMNFEVVSKIPGEAVAITVASDWHLDEVVNPQAIGGINEFNLDIAKIRIKKYFEHSLKLLSMCRSESKIDTLIVAALGDFISGWIHDDLVSSNSLTPPEAIVELFEIWSGGLSYLLNEGNLQEIIFIAACGNHTRITKRIENKLLPQKSFEWPVYNYLVKWFSDPKFGGKIKFKLPTGYFNYFTVLDRQIRFHHGDGIRYLGGIGGIHIPLRKAIDQWNKARRVDLDVMGHWHTRETSRNYVLNGSLIGYSEYSERIKADFEMPQQSFFIIHPRFGKTAEFPIILI